jgi:hypothetical protein
MTAPNRSTGLRTSGPIASLLMPVLLERFLTSAPFSTASSRTRTTRNSSSISSRTTVCVPSFSSDLIARFRLPLADHGLILSLLLHLYHTILFSASRYTCAHPSHPSPGESFPTWSHLQAHLKSAHPPTCPYPSCVNRKPFKSRKNLKAHLQVHKEHEEDERALGEEDTTDEEARRRGKRGKKRAREDDVVGEEDMGVEWEIGKGKGTEMKIVGETGRLKRRKVTSESIAGKDFACEVEGCGKSFKRVCPASLSISFLKLRLQDAWHRPSEKLISRPFTHILSPLTPLPKSSVKPSKNTPTLSTSTSAPSPALSSPRNAAPNRPTRTNIPFSPTSRRNTQRSMGRRRWRSRSRNWRRGWGKVSRWG